MKKLLLCLVCLLSFAFFAGGIAEAAPRHVALLISGHSGDDAESYNDICIEGLERAKRKYPRRIAARIWNIHDDQSRARDTLMEAAKSSSLVLVASYRYVQYLADAVREAPDTSFVIMDGSADPLPNVASVVFRDEEGAFLAGALAAMITERTDFPRMNDSSVVGAVLGEKIESAKRFEKGFRAGVWYINKDIKALCDYTDSFSDADAARKTAAKQHAEGADVIFAAVGRAGQGVIDLAMDEKKFWVIGVDNEQELQYGGAVLTSVVKRMDYLILKLVDIYLQDGFEKKDVTIGLADGAIDLSIWTRGAKQMIPLSIRKELDEISDKIEKGLIIIR